MNDKEIKTGDYARTKFGVIGKITHNHINNGKIWWNTGTKHSVQIDIKIIKKHSSNIIDLVEVGDYVNGYRVYDISTEYLVDINKEGKIMNKKKEGFINATITEGKDDIKSICAREQFENAEYKVEE